MYTQGAFGIGGDRGLPVVLAGMHDAGARPTRAPAPW